VIATSAVSELAVWNDGPSRAHLPCEHRVYCVRSGRREEIPARGDQQAVRETVAPTYSSRRRTRGVPIRYTERLSEAGAVTSVGARGDSFEISLAESVIGLYKTELVEPEADDA